MFFEKQNSQNVKQNGGFPFNERLKWLYSGCKVLLRDYLSTNQSNKKYFWTENNDIEEYDMDI